MQISVFDLFKVGIGPSSSHTVGPMVAANRFLQGLKTRHLLEKVGRIRVSMHGSLAFTGKGHNSDVAIILGLSGEVPNKIEPDRIPKILESVRNNKKILLNSEYLIDFSEEHDLIFDFEHLLPGHSNGMLFEAMDINRNTLSDQIYYSIGGGFVATAHEILLGQTRSQGAKKVVNSFKNANKMLELGKKKNMSIAELIFENEKSGHKDC